MIFGESSTLKELSSFAFYEVRFLFLQLRSLRALGVGLIGALIGTPLKGSTHFGAVHFGAEHFTTEILEQTSNRNQRTRVRATKQLQEGEFMMPK